MQTGKMEYVLPLTRLQKRLHLQIQKIPPKQVQPSHPLTVTNGLVVVATEKADLMADWFEKQFITNFGATSPTFRKPFKILKCLK